MKFTHIVIVFSAALALAASGCKTAYNTSDTEAAKPRPTVPPTVKPTGTPGTTAYRYKDVKPVVMKRCTECHDAPSNYKDLISESYVTPLQPAKSDLLGYADDDSMRASSGKMTAAEKKMITEWILAGAPEG